MYETSASVLPCRRYLLSLIYTPPFLPILSWKAALPPTPRTKIPGPKLGSHLPPSLSLRMSSLWSKYSGATLMASGTLATYGIW